MLIDVEETYNSNVRNFYLNTEILRAGCAELKILPSLRKIY